ncbi:MAG TPA: carbonic anhydrase [Burkholderiaceae bacterium]|nr:carbonic anhydrase [Burkholderiaceae bacterium]
MSDADLIARLRSFERAFPRFEDTYRRLVEEGQRPTTLFIGCSDSRLVPHQLTGTGPGDLFLVRNVGNIVPPWDVTGEGHGSAAAIEFAVLALGVRNIVVCGHSECGGMRALYEPPPEEARHLSRWLVHAHPAKLPEAATPEVLRRVEQRNVVLQLEHLMTYPMVRRGVEGGTLSLHGWHFLLGDGRVLVLDIARGTFEPVERSLERLAADAADRDPAAPR